MKATLLNQDISSQSDDEGIPKVTLRVLKRFLKIYCVVFGAHRIFNILTSAFQKNQYSRSTSSWLTILKRDILSKDSHQLASAISSCSAIHAALNSSLIRTWTGLTRSQQSVIAGILSSLGIFLDSSHERRRSIIVTCFIRSIYFITRGVVYEPSDTTKSRRIQDQTNLKQSATNTQTISKKSANPIRSIYTRSDCPRILRLFVTLFDRHGDLIAWNIYSFYICYVSYAKPDLLTLSYFKSLLFVTGNYFRFGKKDTVHMTRAAGELSREISMLSYLDQQHEPVKIPEGITSKDHLNKWIDISKRVGDSSPNPALYRAIAALEPGLKVLPPQHHHSYLACAALHPGEAKCYEGHLRLMKLSFFQMLRSYLMINGILTLVSILRNVRLNPKEQEPSANDFRQNMRKSTVKHLRRYIFSTIRSATTISAFVYCLAAGVCNIRWLFNREYLISYGISGWLASFAILLENRSRLAELNVYCGIQVLQGIGSYFKIKHNFNPPFALEWGMFASSWTSLALLHHNHEIAIQGIMKPILRFLLGNPSPSNETAPTSS